MLLGHGTQTKFSVVFVRASGSAVRYPEVRHGSTAVS